LLRVAITERQAQNLVIDEPEVAALAGVSEYRGAEYRLSPDVDVEALDKAGLYCGGWLLYASAEVEPPPDILLEFQAVDVFRVASAELVALLNRLGVHFLIASFYDDIDWRVVVPAKSLQAE